MNCFAYKYQEQVKMPIPISLSPWGCFQIACFDLTAQRYLICNDMKQRKAANAYIHDAATAKCLSFLLIKSDVKLLIEYHFH